MTAIIVEVFKVGINDVFVNRTWAAFVTIVVVGLRLIDRLAQFHRRFGQVLAKGFDLANAFAFKRFFQNLD